MLETIPILPYSIAPLLRYLSHQDDQKMEALEIEVKFYLPDIESMQQRILALGAESKGRVFDLR